MMRAAQAYTPAAAAAARRGEKPGGLPLLLLTGLWVLLLFDPQWYLARHGLTPLLKLPVLFFGGLLVALALGVPSDPRWSKRWRWYAPFLAFIAVGAVTLPVSLNNGMAREGLITLLLYWALIVGTVVVVDSVRRAELLLTLYGLQFLWWGLWGAKSGLVSWHHVLANYDGYGAFAVGGIGMCYFYTLASKKGWFRYGMYLAAGLCALAVVASHARGAFLAAVALFGVIWARSPRKGQTMVAGIAGGVIVVVAASVLFEENFFWNEIMSVFSEGTTEGTGEDRWELWKAAWQVYLQNPIFGTGPRNWGVFASQYFEPGDLGGMYAGNPAVLYNRSLHSFYFTTLSELGTVGVIVLIWILVDFWKRNAALRSPEAEQRWRELGGHFKLRPIALGLEAGMVAFLVTASIYAMTGIHWFYTTLGLNLVLHELLLRSGPLRPGRVLSGRRQALAGLPGPMPQGITTVLHVPPPAPAAPPGPAAPPPPASSAAGFSGAADGISRSE